MRTVIQLIVMALHAIILGIVGGVCAVHGITYTSLTFWIIMVSLVLVGLINYVHGVYIGGL